MTDSAFISLVLGGIVLVYWAAFTWGKWAKIFKELGRAV